MLKHVSFFLAHLECGRAKAVVHNPVVFFCANKLYVSPVMFSNEAKDADSCADFACIGQIYADLQHFVEIGSLAVILQP